MSVQCNEMCLTVRCIVCVNYVHVCYFTCVLINEFNWVKRQPPVRKQVTAHIEIERRLKCTGDNQANYGKINEEFCPDL